MSGLERSIDAATRIDEIVAGYRASDPESSREAAESVSRDGTLPRQARECLAFLRSHPGRTTAELGDLHETLDRYVFARRMADLEKAGLVWSGDIRDCLIGRRSRPWWPIDLTDRNLQQTQMEW